MADGTIGLWTVPLAVFGGEAPEWSFASALSLAGVP